MQTTPSGDVVRVAIQANTNAVLFKLEQDQPLEKVIREICQECSIGYEKGKFALQLLPQVSEPEVFLYITEFNRYMIKNGRELKLVYSPQLMAKMIHEKLNSKAAVENLSWAIKKAAICSADSTFCKEFFPSGYLALRILLNESLLTRDLYKKSLQTILNLIRTNYLKELDRDFLIQLKKIITSDQHIEEGIIEAALEILEAIIFASGNSELITKLISLDELVHHIWSRDAPTIQTNTLALINSMALKSLKLKTQKLLLQKMSSQPFRDNIYVNIISSDAIVPPPLAHVLYVYQSLVLTLEKDRYRNVIKSESLLPDLEPILKSNKTKSEMDAEYFDCLKSTSSNRLSSISVENNDDIDEFSPTPSITSSVLYASDDEDVDDTVFIPETKRRDSKKDNFVSQLTFDCVFFFYNNHRDDYKIALLDEGNNYTQFLRTCEQIVQILCVKVLRIGNIPESGETSYCPLVFLTTHPFLEELFSKAINLLHKTKREMKAKITSDLDKVFQVLQRQLLEALASQPLSFDRLETVLGTLSYWTVRNQWQEEQIERERHTLANSPAIRQLKQSLVDETKELVKKQRLQYIKNGTEFPVWNAQRNQRVKNKTWFVFLTSNEKAIQYECEGEVSQLPVQSVNSLVTGRRCPHIKHSKSRATNGELAFSLVTEESSLDFIAPTQEVYDHWTDAINVLLGNDMKSVSTKRDMNCLLEMELRLRLLDTDGIDLPAQPPPVPLDPPNYDFSLPQAD